MTMPRGVRKAAGKINQRSTGKEDAQIGGRIRALRMDRKLSQSDLAKALGVSFQQIQKYERGMNRVSAVRLNQIAKLLNTSMEQLMGLDDGPQVDGFDFDIESYKLAKTFKRLPDRLKPKFRSLMNSVIEEDII